MQIFGSGYGVRVLVTVPPNPGARETWLHPSEHTSVLAKNTNLQSSFRDILTIDKRWLRRSLQRRTVAGTPKNALD